MKRGNQISWLWLVISLIGLIGLSFGLAYLLQDIGVRFHLPLYELAWLAYLSIFGTTLICNFTIIAPVPVATAIMIAAATRWDPIMVALAASIDGTLGELSGYYAGYLGKRIANVLPFAQIISLSAHRLYYQLLGRQSQTKIKVVTESTDRVNPYPYTRRQYLHYSQYNCRN